MCNIKCVNHFNKMTEESVNVGFCDFINNECIMKLIKQF